MWGVKATFAIFRVPPSIFHLLPSNCVAASLFFFRPFPPLLIFLSTFFLHFLLSFSLYLRCSSFFSISINVVTTPLHWCRTYPLITCSSPVEDKMEC